MAVQPFPPGTEPLFPFDHTTAPADEAGIPPDHAAPCLEDPVTGWDRVSVIEALTVAARREREAKVDQLILIARAAEVWTWIDNLDEVVAQIEIADRISDTTTRQQLADAAEAGDEDAVDNLVATAAPSVGRSAPGQMYGERLYRYGSDGTPAVSEFLRLEVGPALGMTPDAAARLIGDVLDLRHRLPGMWTHVETGRVQGWVACQVARRTRAAQLPAHLCRELDRRISPYAPGWAPSRILSQTDKLIVTLDPETAESRRRDELGRRYVEFWSDKDPSGAGMRNLRARLDAVPAADLEATLTALAEVLETVRPDLPAATRHAWALELLANPPLAAAVLAGDLTNLADHHIQPPGVGTGPGRAGPDDAGPSDGGRGKHPDADSPDAVPDDPCPDDGGPENDAGTTPGPSGAVEAFVKPTPGAAPVVTGREVSLFLHVNPADLDLGAGGAEIRLGHLVRTLLDQLIADAARNGTVIVKPVIDPMAVSVSESATPPASMAERIRHRNPTVVFPFSERASTSRHVDLDHTIPRPEGPTTEPNLGPLDRRAHRWKTHTTCRLVQIRNGTFTWHTPAGQTFTVTPHGTYRDDPGPDWPTPPSSRTAEQQTADLIARARQAFDRTTGPDPDRPARPGPAQTPPSDNEPSSDKEPPPDEEPPPF